MFDWIGEHLKKEAATVGQTRTIYSGASQEDPPPSSVSVSQRRGLFEQLTKPSASSSSARPRTADAGKLSSPDSASHASTSHADDGYYSVGENPGTTSSQRSERSLSLFEQLTRPPASSSSVRPKAVDAGKLSAPDSVSHASASHAARHAADGYFTEGPHQPPQPQHQLTFGLTNTPSPSADSSVNRHGVNNGSKTKTPSNPQLEGVVKTVKLEKQFGFITPVETLPEPFTHKDVHFNLRDFLPMQGQEGQTPQAGDTVMFILRNNSHERPTAYKLFPPGCEPLAHQPRMRAQSRDRRASSEQRNKLNKGLGASIGCSVDGGHGSDRQANRYRSTENLLTSPQSGTAQGGGRHERDVSADRNGSDQERKKRRATEDIDDHDGEDGEISPRAKAPRRKGRAANKSPAPQLQVLTRLGHSRANLAQGTVVAIGQRNAGFIKATHALPTDYKQDKDIYFDLTRAKAGQLQMRLGDRVEFSLGTKDKDRPMAIGVKLIECKPRGEPLLARYIEEMAENVDAITKKSHRDPAHSEYIVSVLSCQAVWECIGRCESLGYQSTGALLQLLVKLEGQYRSMSTLFSGALKALTQTTFLNPWKGCLRGYVITCFQKRDEAAILILHKFLLMLIQLVPEKTRAAVSLVKPVVSSTPSSAEYMLYSMLKMTAKFSANSVEDMEWDELPPVPSASDLLTGPLEGEINLRPVKQKGAYDTAHDYLDIYFRLLRADCFEALKKGIRAFLDGDLDPRDMNLYQNVHLVGIQLTRQDNGLALGLKVTPQRPVRNWNTCSNLMFGNLLCISPNATFRDAIWATVVNRSALNAHQIVAVELCTECNSLSDSEAVLLLESMNGQTIMVESPTYYRAYKPVLKALQKLDPDQLPFDQELVKAQTTMHIPEFLQEDPDGTLDGGIIYRGGGPMNVIALGYNEGSAGETSLDVSQETAIKQSLMHRIAIIQGPPGTGKTFVGVKLVKLLLSMSCAPGGPILVLTYKNHALDEFLKGMLNAGVTEIVRVGGRSDPDLDRYNMNQIRKEKKISAELFQHLKGYQLELEDVKTKVEDAFELLDNARSFSCWTLITNLNSEQLTSLLLGCDWSKIKSKHGKKGDASDHIIDRKGVEQLLASMSVPLGDFMRTSGNGSTLFTVLLQLIKQATVQWAPKEATIKKVEEMMKSTVTRVNLEQLLAQNKMKKSPSLEELYSEKDIEDETTERTAALDYQKTTRSEDLMNEFKLIRENKKGGHNLFGVTRDVVLQEPIHILRSMDDVWSLQPEDRVKLIQVLLLQQYEDTAPEFEDQLEEYQELCALKNELEIQHRAAILSGVKVLGMTITGASIHQQLLEEVKPAIVIVEEAAEVLEPQITAIIGKWVKQLVLIGDHKQLRPSVESFKLKQEYNFDISMMERLINNGFPYSTLTMQNRMLPEFAELLLDIYPKLQSNLARVGNNTPANCVQHSMYFWDHQHEETSGRSHSNEEEAKRAVRLALFLIQQGYKPSQITILAPYQGQVAQIRKKVRMARDSYKELFEDELQDPGSDSHERETDGNRIDVQTIDMYQGDENDFIIVSLVRSNPKNISGFVKTLNRRCVAQSRAKRGMYFIGNYNTISSAPAWKEMLRKMDAKGFIGPVLPLQCPRHPETKLLTKEAEDITLSSFCKILCNAVMSCRRHRCLKTCQPSHLHVRCEQIVRFSFEKCGHLAKRKCFIPETAVRCKQIVDFIFKKCGHPSTRECYMSETEMVCHKKMSTLLACKHFGTHECCEKPESVRCMEPCQKLLRCSHPCQRKCCQPCDHDGCEECERIRKKKAELLRKQHEELIKKVKEQTEKDLKELEKNWKEGVVCQELIPGGDTASEYYDVEDKVKKYIQPGHKWFPIVKKIEKVSNPKLEKKWMERKLKVIDPSRVEKKFHGTTTEATAKIIEGGFLMPAPKKQMYGPGIYFATDSSKSAQEIYTKGSNALLLCDVLLGKTLTVQSAETGMTLQKLKTKGYDSLFAKRGSQKTGGVLNDEFVVYHPDQAIPRYIVHYEKADVTDVNVAKQLDQLEAEAIKTGKMVCHKIKSKRELKMGDPLEIHYRIAESQVLRLLKGSSMEVASVDYYINPPLLQKFNAKLAEFAKKHSKSKEADYILAFHGTKAQNIDGIVKDNFRLDKLATNTGDKGYYGAGIYFSEFPSVSLGYGQSILLCRVLPGKSYDCPGLMMGAGLESGFDSHRFQKDKEGRGVELVIFDTAQILPCYVIHLK